MNAFLQAVQHATGSAVLHSLSLNTLQINVGLRCNLSCQHCHLAAGPDRREEMSWQTMEQILELTTTCGCRLVDITGGAPELHPRFTQLVIGLRERGVTVQVRSNLAVLLLPAMNGMAEFLKAHQVRLVGSMPCYLEANVDAQRGEGAYQQLVTAMALLNRLGYGHQPELVLNLVYNPGGPALPPNQQNLEATYRRELASRNHLAFTNLLTITNMPIGRFRAHLRRQGRDEEYLDLLRRSFNPHTLEGLMCRHQISVGWDGQLYDCDFNLAMGFPVTGSASLAELANQRHRAIVTGDHCLACTAGCGSSCGGALAA